MNIQLLLYKIGFNHPGSLRYRFISGAFWSIFGNGFAQFCGLVSGIFVARLLDLELYGKLGTIRQTIGMFGVFAGFGMGLTATKHVAEFRTSDPEKAGRIWGLISVISWVACIFVTMVLMCGARFLSVHILKAPELTSLLRLAAVLLVFNAMSNVQNGLLAGFEAFRYTAFINLLRGILTFIFSVVGVCYFGLSGVVLGLGLALLVSYFYGLILLKKRAHQLGIRWQPRKGLKDLTSIATFSATTICSALVFISAEWIAVAILVRQPNGFDEMGYYNVANQWINMIAFLPLMLANPSLSLMANMYGERRFEQFCKVFWGNIKIVGGVTAIIALMVGILSPWIMLLYGAEYTGGTIILQIMCIMITLRSIIRVTSQSLLSMGRVREELIFGSIWAIFFICCWLMLINQGTKGMVLARTAANVIFLILQGGFVLYLIKRLK